MLDGNTAALDAKERDDYWLDVEATRREEAAELEAFNRLKFVDGDVMQEAMKTATAADWAELAEDLGDGPMKDLAHAGSVMREVLKRYLYNQCLAELE